MTGEQLIVELVSIVEQTCYPRFDEHGGQEPITAEQWDVVADKILKLCAKNRPREITNE